MSYKRIMLAIDKDDISKDALFEVISLAKILHANLKIVHVIDEGILADVENIPAISNEIKILEDSSRDFLHSAANMARNAGMEPEIKLLKITKRNRHIAFEIANEAKEWSADLLVVGAYSRSGYHKLLLGHVAESILRIVTIPILILHTGETALQP